MALARVSSYRGPACPRCKKPLELAQAGDGPNNCVHCGGEFEARVFRPASRSQQVVQLAQGGPEAGTACANHPRNAAVTSCERCGIFICSLCELQVDGSNYCPACFERLAQEGAIPSARVRFRAFHTLAFIASFLGLITFPIFGLPLGALGCYYVFKGFRTRNVSGTPAGSLILAGLLSLADIIFGAIILFGLLSRHK
jgi:ribosomal protein L37AE/L43A